MYSFPSLSTITAGNTLKQYGHREDVNRISLSFSSNLGVEPPIGIAFLPTYTTPRSLSNFATIAGILLTSYTAVHSISVGVVYNSSYNEVLDTESMQGHYCSCVLLIDSATSSSILLGREVF